MFEHNWWTIVEKPGFVDTCWHKWCDHYRIKCKICLLVFGVCRCRSRRRHVCVYIFRCPCCHESLKALAASDMRDQKQGAAPLSTRGGAGGPRSHTVVLCSSNAAVFFFQRCGAAASSTARVHHNGGPQTCTNCSSYRCALPCGGHRAAKKKERDAARANHNESDAHLQCSVATGDAQIDVLTRREGGRAQLECMQCNNFECKV